VTDKKLIILTYKFTIVLALFSTELQSNVSQIPAIQKSTINSNSSQENQIDFLCRYQHFYKKCLVLIGFLISGINIEYKCALIKKKLKKGKKERIKKEFIKTKSKVQMV